MADNGKTDVKTDGHIAYGLFASSLLVGVTAIAGIIFCYIKRSAHEDALWQGHITWLIRTFWISLVIFLVSIPLTVVLIGGLTMLLGGVWFIYRIIKGWIMWNDGKPIADPQSFF